MLFFREWRHRKEPERSFDPSKATPHAILSHAGSQTERAIKNHLQAGAPAGAQKQKGPALGQPFRFLERPQPDLNRRRRRERPVSWTGLDDGDIEKPEPI